MRVLVLLCVASIASSAFAQGLTGTRASTAARSGWQAIREGRSEDAATAFAVALADEPRDPTLHLGAGIAAQFLGDNARARESFEQALKLAPGFTTASLALGDLLFRESDLQGAIAVFDTAQRYAPGDATVRARLDRLRAEPSAETGSFQSRSAHFTVLFDGRADDAIARRAVEVLESAYWRVGTALYTFPDHVITVVLYTEEQFRDTTRSPSWAAGAYDGRIRIPMRGALEQEPGELDRVLTHELTHAMIRDIAPRGIPTWLNEGLAVMFETQGSAWASNVLASSPGRMNLGDLAGSFDGFSGTQARLAYAESAEAARRLFDQAGGAGVVALLQDLGRGLPLSEAFERRTLTSYSAFAAGLR